MIRQLEAQSVSISLHGLHCASGLTGQRSGEETVNSNRTLSGWPSVTKAGLLSRCIIGALYINFHRPLSKGCSNDRRLAAIQHNTGLIFGRLRFAINMSWGGSEVVQRFRGSEIQR